MPPRILEAVTPETLAIARGLFEEYAAALEVDLGFQHFAEELAGLPGEYIRPAGGLMLGFEGSEPVLVEANLASCFKVCTFSRQWAAELRGRDLRLAVVAAGQP